MKHYTLEYTLYDKFFNVVKTGTRLSTKGSYREAREETEKELAKNYPNIYWFKVK